MDRRFTVEGAKGFSGGDMISAESVAKYASQLELLSHATALSALTTSEQATRRPGAGRPCPSRARPSSSKLRRPAPGRAPIREAFFVAIRSTPPISVRVWYYTDPYPYTRPSSTPYPPHPTPPYAQAQAYRPSVAAYPIVAYRFRTHSPAYSPSVVQLAITSAGMGMLLAILVTRFASCYPPRSHFAGLGRCGRGIGRHRSLFPPHVRNEWWRIATWYYRSRALPAPGYHSSSPRASVANGEWRVGASGRGRCAVRPHLRDGMERGRRGGKVYISMKTRTIRTRTSESESLRYGAHRPSSCTPRALADRDNAHSAHPRPCGIARSHALRTSESKSEAGSDSDSEEEEEEEAEAEHIVRSASPSRASAFVCRSTYSQWARTECGGSGGSHAGRGAAAGVGCTAWAGLRTERCSWLWSAVGAAAVSGAFGNNAGRLRGAEGWAGRKRSEAGRGGVQRRCGARARDTAGLRCAVALSESRAAKPKGCVGNQRNNRRSSGRVEARRGGCGSLGQVKCASRAAGGGTQGSERAQAEGAEGEDAH
ncbi:hypothetical protein B0H17DRAFT_1144377 [Mycena rosella]|uniref:Uncharacterized protein n=1 Tax=Mycena rosella TaxID=1033263 RepID=A0AAD7G2Z6_MYCRO|nr:hypothetical protein B0H17DRAFT_1144377 [Mycena rosella]